MKEINDFSQKSCTSFTCMKCTAISVLIKKNSNRSMLHFTRCAELVSGLFPKNPLRCLSLTFTTVLRMYNDFFSFDFINEPVRSAERLSEVMLYPLQDSRLFVQRDKKEMTFFLQRSLNFIWLQFRKIKKIFQSPPLTGLLANYNLINFGEGKVEKTRTLWNDRFGRWDGIRDDTCHSEEQY